MNRPTTPATPGPTAALPHARGAPGSGWRGYVLAALVALIGATAAVLWAVTGFLDQLQHPEQFARTAVPGEAAVAITQTGAHVVYVEGTGSAQISAADLTVVGPQGEQLAVRPYTRDLRYDVPGAPGHMGTALAVFDAERTGTYRVGAPAVPADPTTLAVGDDLAPGVVRAVVVPSIIGVLVLLAGIGLAVATWIHRDRRSQS